MQLCKKIQQFSLHHATALYQIKTVTVSIICKQEKTAFKFRDNGIYKSLIQKVIFSLQFLLTEFYNKYQSATKQVS